MFRLRTLITLSALAAALVVATTALSMTHPRLTGTVGPGFTITLKRGTVPVKMVKAGTYTFAVSDKSNIHNFHLTGPGLNKQITTIGFVGTKTVTLTLKKGTYKFVCDPHFTSMHGTFKVT